MSPQKVAICCTRRLKGTDGIPSEYVRLPSKLRPCCFSDPTSASSFISNNFEGSLRKVSIVWNCPILCVLIQGVPKSLQHHNVPFEVLYFLLNYFIYQHTSSRQSLSHLWVKHPDIQTKKRIHRYSFLIFFHGRRQRGDGGRAPSPEFRG